MNDLKAYLVVMVGSLAPPLGFMAWWDWRSTLIALGATAALAGWICFVVLCVAKYVQR